MKGLTLQQRDWALMTLIAEHGFATPEAIALHFWPNSKRTTHYRRLKQLEVSGYLEPAIGDAGRRLGYALARRGRQALQQSGRVDGRTYLAPRAAYRTAYDHDHELLKIRKIICEAKSVSNYVPDLVLRTQAAVERGRRQAGRERWKVPDAIFRLLLGTRSLNIALELETARKSESRYDVALRHLATAATIDSTFFVCGTSEIKSTLARHIARLRTQDPAVIGCSKYHGFYFVSLGNLLSQTLDAPFQGEGKTFTLRQLDAGI